MKCQRNVPIRSSFRIRAAVALLIPCVAASLVTLQDSVKAGGSGTHVVLVELFTSEGCSSCPPSDAYLQTLDSTQPLRGAEIIVLSEHVNYWDHEGWKDPWSSSALTDRQSDYVRAANVDSPFTPEFVVDGKPMPSPPTELGKVLQTEAAAEKIPVVLTGVTIDAGSPNRVRGHIDIDGSDTAHSADVFAAVALGHAQSQVSKGENRGKQLSHTAVTLELIRVGKLEKGGHFSKDLALDLKTHVDRGNVRLIVFVQEAGPGRVIGAALWKASSRAQ